MPLGTWRRTSSPPALPTGASSRWRRRPAPACPSGAPDEQPGRGLLADRSLTAVQPHGDLTRGGVGIADLELRTGNESLVVEPVQQVAVVLGEANDRRPLSGVQLGE